MSSNETKKEKTEKCSARRENVDIDDKFTHLSCPFTWGMEDVIENRNKLSGANENRFEMVVDIQDNFPEFSLIYHLLLAYENVMSNDQLPSAMQSLNKAEESLADIKQKATLEDVENILEHIFVATKCHVLQKLGQATEADELLEGICDIDDINNAESAMLNGCQCLAWSLYYATDNLMAIKYSQKAIEYQNDNGKWYFLLGKQYRRLRRRHNSIGEKPSPEEISAFDRAFDLSPNVLFGVSLAQLYRESLNYPMANKIYKQVYDLKPTCCKVRLQLALGFIRAKQFSLAKNCLDYVAEKMPNSTIYFHYMGIYLEKYNRDFKGALSYYKKTTENSNSAAEWQYVACKKKVEPDWDPLPYMLSLLEKYNKDSDHFIQGINIQIGAHYLFEKRDILLACRYLTKAIEISPNAKILKDHLLLFSDFEKVNIYHALTKEIQFALQNRAGIYDSEEMAILKETLQLCRTSCTDSRSSSGSARGYRNYGRGLSSRAGINVGGQRPGLSSRGFPMNHPKRSSGDAQDPSIRSSESLRGRDNTSWRQNDRITQGNQNEYRSLRTLKDERDRASTDHVRGRGIRLTASSKHGDKKDDSEADASCCLVKTLKDLNI